MNKYPIWYYVEVDFYSGDYINNTFSNEENARKYLNECIEEGELNKNPVIFYRIARSEVSGGIIVGFVTITEWNDENEGY